MESKKEIVIILSEIEKTFYTKVFNKLASEVNNEKIIFTDTVKGLFTSSKIPKKDLALIWNNVVEKNSKGLNEQQFFNSLKLISLRQNYNTCDIASSYLKTTLPLPILDYEGLKEIYDECKSFYKKEYIAPKDDIQVKIVDTQFIESGYLGFSSHYIYKIETKSNVNGYDPKKVYVVQRRFKDFEWLHSKFINVEKYKGCILPPLPPKKFIGNTNNDFIEQRKNELQIFLQVLATHNLTKYDSILKLFLTCDKADEFEKFKNDPTGYNISDQSFAMNSLKSLQISDTVNYIYSQIKTKFFDKTEPAEFDSQTEVGLSEISNKIVKYIPILSKLQFILETEIKHIKDRELKKEDLANSLAHFSEEFTNMHKVYKESESFFKKQELIEKAQIDSISVNISVIKEEKLQLEGIQMALNERKSQIERYKYVNLFLKSRSEKGLGQDIVETNININELKQELEKLKDNIKLINKNVKMELDEYNEIRAEKLSCIIKSICLGEVDNANRAKEFFGDKHNFFLSYNNNLEIHLKKDKENKNENQNQNENENENENEKNNDKDRDKLQGNEEIINSNSVLNNP